MFSSNMITFSSNFFSPKPNVPHILTKKPPSSHPQIINSILKEKPQTTATTKSSPTPKVKSPKTKTIPQINPPTLKPSNIGPSILNALEDIINKLIDPPTQPSVDPRVVLSNNFAPVQELPPTKCEIIEGTLPSCLNGAYIRNGPNPQFFPSGPYHLFDGDGMLHSIRISNQDAVFSCRFVKTNKYIAEKKAGGNIFPNIFGGVSGLKGSLARGVLAVIKVIAMKFDASKGVGVANTSIALLGNKLYALYESDLPYEVRISRTGDILTLGRCDYDGALELRMTAHPKVDFDTGESFAFFYDLISPPFLTYLRFDSKGNIHKNVPIFTIQKPSYVHDFAITKKYAIFPDIQISLDPMRMILRGESLLRFNPNKVSRIGIIPKYCNDEKDLKWFNVPNFNIIHAINAWDEVDEFGKDVIVMVAPNISSPEHTLERMDLIHATIEKVKIELESGLVTRQTLSRRNLDFSVINPAYVGKENKYVYAAVGEPMPKITGVVKLDVSITDQQECIVASRLYEPGCYGGEPFFVAKDGLNEVDEDDGYLVSYVHNENNGESRFIVMDAKSPMLDVVASVKLPQRVPYGFHGLFVRERDLNTF